MYGLVWGRGVGSRCGGWVSLVSMMLVSQLSVLSLSFLFVVVHQQQKEQEQEQEQRHK